MCGIRNIFSMKSIDGQLNPYAAGTKFDQLILNNAKNVKNT